METILPLLIWGGLFFLMMRFGCGSHMFGRGHGADDKKGASAEGHGGGCGTSGGKPARTAADAERLTWEAPEKDVDPVCGETVATATAKSSVHGGEVYYFCSRECREAFEASPETYVVPNARRRDRLVDHDATKGGSHG